MTYASFKRPDLKVHLSASSGSRQNTDIKGGVLARPGADSTVTECINGIGNHLEKKRTTPYRNVCDFYFLYGVVLS